MAKSKKGGEQFSFEDSMSRLEKIVDRLESGELTLEQSLKEFEEGVGLVKVCRDYLEGARRKVEVLVGEQGGRALIEPYEEDVDEDDGEEED